MIVWLGPAQQSSDLAFSLVRKVYGKRHSLAQVVELSQQSQWRLAIIELSHLLDRSYWSKMWILQELLVARDILICCGTDSIDAEVLFEVQKILGRQSSDRSSHEVIYHFELNDLFVRITVCRGGLAKIHSLRNVYSTAHHDKMLFDCLMQQNQKATDPRDMICALASLVNADTTSIVRVDYSKTVEQVYTDFAVSEILRSKELIMLTRGLRSLIRYSLPSWVPDWTSLWSTGRIIFAVTSDVSQQRNTPGQKSDLLQMTKSWRWRPFYLALLRKLEIFLPCLLLKIP